MPVLKVKILKRFECLYLVRVPHGGQSAVCSPTVGDYGGARENTSLDDREEREGIPSVYKFDVPPGHQRVIDAKHPLLPGDSAAVVLPLHHYGLVHLNGPPCSSKLEESRGVQ